MMAKTTGGALAAPSPSTAWFPPLRVIMQVILFRGGTELPGSAREDDDGGREPLSHANERFRGCASRSSGLRCAWGRARFRCQDRRNFMGDVWLRTTGQRLVRADAVTEISSSRGSVQEETGYALRVVAGGKAFTLIDDSELVGSMDER